MTQPIRFFCLSTAFLVASICSAQESKLLLTLKCPSKISIKNKNDFFHISLTNTRQRDLYIYKDLSLGMTLEVWDHRGRRIQANFVGDLCPTPPPNPGEKTFFAVPPGKSISTIYDRSFTMLGITKPGQYTARALFFYSTENSPNDIGPSLIDNPLCSAKVTFYVEP